MRPCNHCCSGKAISITYSECVAVALDTHHAQRAGYYIVMWLVRLYHIFLYCIINDKIFGKPLVNIKKCVLISCTFSFETFLILRRTERDLINVLTSTRKVPAILVRF
jgi:hypothetical protein